MLPPDEKKPAGNGTLLAGIVPPGAGCSKATQVASADLFRTIDSTENWDDKHPPPT